MIKKYISLPPVPLDNMDETWMIVRGACPNTPKLTQFMVYTVTTWTDSSARFSRAAWNHSQDMEEKSTRTNNVLGSWHGRLRRKKAGQVHPNKLELAELLKEEQVDTERELTQFIAGAEPRRRKTKTRRLNRRLCILKKRPQKGTTDLCQYGETVAKTVAL